MGKLEDVKQALRLCRYDPDPYDDNQPCKVEVSCEICPYWDDERGCRETDLYNDALELLEKTEPRVMTLDEAMEFDGAFCIEYNPALLRKKMNWAIIHFMDDEWVHFSYPPIQEGYAIWKYGKTWRCWTAKPTDEQRKAAKWDEL